MNLIEEEVEKGAGEGGGIWSTEGLKARLRSQALGKGQEQRPSEQPAVGTEKSSKDCHLRWDKLKSSIDIYTLPYVKQTASGKLLYHTGRSAQWLCDNLEGWNGGEAQEGGDRCILLIYVVVRQKPTTL